jgi:hypothetical protein
MCFSTAASSEKDQGAMIEDRIATLDPTVGRCHHPAEGQLCECVSADRVGATN